jgi:hypothetical protein
MRVLLLHPEDDVEGSWSRERWDLIVDLGRAPKSSYEEWSCRLGCRIFSIFDLAVEVEDLRVWRGLLALGMGRVVDRCGIDWWDVFGLLLQAELANMRLVTRLAEVLRLCRTLAVTRSSVMADALQVQLGIPLTVFQSGLGLRVTNRVLRYGTRLANLSFEQLRQVAYDKFDTQYVWRRKFARAPEQKSEPVILLPTAYSNVTKTALQYARRLPEQRFLLVLARESAAASNLPANVRMLPLAVFARKPAVQGEVQELANCWIRLEQHLQELVEFRLAVQVGILKQGQNWLRWGLSVRDAWRQVFATNVIAGCLSADDSNPYTRIPLLVARQQGVSAVACHHGALDGRMAFKTPCFSTYLTQGEMERDYLERICVVDAWRIRIGAAGSSEDNRLLWSDNSPWIVFFTEPYETDLWRTEAVYREVLPRLCAAGRAAGKAVLLKLHPFESARQRRRLVKRALSENDQKLVSVTDAPLSAEILSKTWCAVTVESTTALECAVVGIPVFLCGWMRHVYAGYALQYVRFGVGRMMEWPDQLLRIPEMLKEGMPAAGVAKRLLQTISSEELSRVLLQSSTGTFAKVR